MWVIIYVLMGIYSLEQWESGVLDYDFEKIVDWMIEHVKTNLK